MVVENISGTTREGIRHARVSPDGITVVISLPPLLKNPSKGSIPLRAKTQLTGDYLLGKIALTDKDWHDINRGRKHLVANRRNRRFQLPKAFLDLGESALLSKRITMEINRITRISIQGRPMSDQDQSGI